MDDSYYHDDLDELEELYVEHEGDFDDELDEFETLPEDEEIDE